jgi:hypothetical protein
MYSPVTILDVFCDEATFQEIPKSWKYTFLVFPLIFSMKLCTIDAQLLPGPFPAIGFQFNFIPTEVRASFLDTVLRFIFAPRFGEGHLAGLLEQLLDLDSHNTWDVVVDTTSARGGSFRMQFCDKFARGQKERRPVCPERVLRFKFNDDDGTVSQEVLHWPTQLSKVEWLQRASVRLLARGTSDSIPPLTSWAPPPDVATSRPISTQIHDSASSTCGSLAQEILDAWQADQRS